MSTDQRPATSPMTPETPATRRRIRDQQLQRSKVLAVIVVLACVLVATVGLRVSDPGDENFRAVKGELGTMLKIDGVELTISDVRVGQLIADGEEIQSRTTGMFVLIRVELANPDTLENYVLNHAQLLSGKRIYDPYGSLTNIAAEPGYLARSDFLFEVDPQQIDGLTLQIWNQGIVSGYHDRARIHLGITAGNAEQWRQAAKDGLIIKQSFTQTEVLR